MRALAVAVLSTGAGPTCFSSRRSSVSSWRTPRQPSCILGLKMADPGGGRVEEPSSFEGVPGEGKGDAGAALNRSQVLMRAALKASC